MCARARAFLSLSLSLARSKNFNPHIQQLRNVTTKSSGACSWRWEFMTIYLRVCFCVLCFVSVLGLCCRGWIFARHSTLHTSTKAAQQRQQEVENPETKTAEYNFFQLLAQKYQNSRRLLSTVLTCVNIKSQVSTTKKDSKTHTHKKVPRKLRWEKQNLKGILAESREKKSSGGGGSKSNMCGILKTYNTKWDSENNPRWRMRCGSNLCDQNRSLTRNRRARTRNLWSRQTTRAGTQLASERTNEAVVRSSSRTALSKCLRLPRVVFLFDVDTVSYFPLSFPQIKLPRCKNNSPPDFSIFYFFSLVRFSFPNFFFFTVFSSHFL